MISSTSTSKRHFYPRPPRGGRPACTTTARQSTRFLSTPSARRATFSAQRASGWSASFLSTPSARRATRRSREQSAGRRISIHALREEGDLPPLQFTGSQFQFLSTPSARRATVIATAPAGWIWDFYPRPPRGGRPILPHGMNCKKNFYPRPPRGGRRPQKRAGLYCRMISIHALREEGDLKWSCRETKLSHFYPRPPRGGRL